MIAKAVAKYIRMSPRKVRQVADLIRGKSVEESLNLLHFVQKRASKPIEKVVHSAIANAMNKEEASKLNPEDFFIKEIWVDQGPSMRRLRYGPMGRGNIIRKRFCHINVVVTDEAP